MDVLIQPKANTLNFSKAIQDNPVADLGRGSYEQNIQQWQFPIPYYQKLQYEDNIALQFHVAGDGSTLTLKVYDQNKNYISAATSYLNTFPALKYPNGQSVSGNEYIDPVTGDTTSLFSWMWAFRLGDILAEIPGDGMYYFQLSYYSSDTTNTYTYWSEQFILRKSHPFTKLIDFSFNNNNSEKNIIVTGWTYDGTITYNPIFTIRVESFKNMFSPKAVTIGYLQQDYEQLQIKTLQQPCWKLTIGENCLGIPYWMAEKVTEAIIADNLWLDKYPYIYDMGDSKTSLVDIWKLKDKNVIPLVRGEIAVRERYPQNRALVQGSLTLWTSPMDGNSPIFPYAIQASNFTVNGTTVVDLPNQAFYTPTDELNFLDKLNSYYVDLYYLLGNFTHTEGVWQYQPDPTETITSPSGVIVLDESFYMTFLATGGTGTYSGAYIGFQQGDSSTSHITIDWGNGLRVDVLSVTAWTDIYSLFTYGTTYTIRIFHDDNTKQIRFGKTVYSSEHGNWLTLNPNYPHAMTYIRIAGNLFTPTSVYFDLDRCPSLIDILFTSNNTVSFTNTLFNINQPGLAYLNFYGNALTSAQVDAIFNQYLVATPTPPSSGIADVSGGTNGVPTFASATARNTLITTYGWTIYHN